MQLLTCYSIYCNIYDFMGEVVPLTPELQPHVDKALRRQYLSQQRRHNLATHGLPVGVLLVGLAGFCLAAGLRAGESDQPAVEYCGIGYAEANGGAYSILDRAIANAGLTGEVYGYHEAASKINVIDTEIHRGERFKIIFEGGRIAVDSIQQITEPVNSCNELAPQP